MLGPYVFIPLLLLTCGFALWRGRGDEKLAALACLAATIATRFVISPLAVRYSSIEVGLLAIDLGMLFVFTYIALRTERFWPLWVAGLQLTNSMAHLLKAVEVQLIPKAYAAAAIFWSYPILIIILIGTWRTSRRHSADREASAG